MHGILAKRFTKIYLDIFVANTFHKCKKWELIVTLVSLLSSRHVNLSFLLQGCMYPWSIVKLTPLLYWLLYVVAAWLFLEEEASSMSLPSSRKLKCVIGNCFISKMCKVTATISVANECHEMVDNWKYLMNLTASKH